MEFAQVAKDFSASEVFFDEKKGQLVLSVFVAVPEAFPVRYKNEEGQVMVMHLDFLPPIEVALTKLPQQDGPHFRADLNCLWLRFAQMQKVAYALNRAFRKEADLATNVDNLLSSGWDIFDCLGLSKGLDLSWRDPSADMGRLVYEPKRASQPQSAGLAVYMCSTFPKSLGISALMECHNVTRKADYFLTGRCMAKCSIGGICAGDDVPSSRLLQPCHDKTHLVCLPCLVGWFKRSPEARLTCRQYGCYSELDCDRLSKFAKNEPELYNKIIYAEHRRVLDRAMGKDRFHFCPRCNQDNGPKEYLQHFGITYCFACHECWCEACLSFDSTKDGLYNSKCLFRLGAYVAESVETLGDLQLLVGRAKMDQAIKNYNHQVEIVNNCIPCPQCAMAIFKAEGCNKVVCSRCNQFFCFQCGEALLENRAYDHFQVGRCVLVDPAGH